MHLPRESKKLSLFFLQHGAGNGKTRGAAIKIVSLTLWKLKEARTPKGNHHAEGERLSGLLLFFGGGAAVSSGKRANKDEASERGEGLIRYPSPPLGTLASRVTFLAHSLRHPSRLHGCASAAAYTPQYCSVLYCTTYPPQFMQALVLGEECGWTIFHPREERTSR